MNKFILISIVAIICAMILASSVATENEVSDKENDTTEIIYILKEYNGRLALYKYGEKHPYNVYDIQVESLPQQDTENLKRGIAIKNEYELKQLISDYTS